MESKAVAVVPDPLSFLEEGLCVHLRQGSNRLAERVELREEFPRAFALDEASDPSFLACRGQ